MAIPMGNSVPRIALAGVLGAALAFGYEHAEARRDEAAAAMTRAAKAFLAGLDETSRARAALTFDDPARTDWHFVPRDRRGVLLAALDDDDRANLDKLMATGLSESGRALFQGVLDLEAILFESESRPGAPAEGRDPGRYAVAIFGEPGVEPWAWRVEGHHWSASFTSTDPSTIAVAPFFVGANPARVEKGSRSGFELLGAEDGRARAFLASLAPEERQKAKLSGTTPADIVLAPGKSALEGEPLGVRAKHLSVEKSAALLSLVDEYFAELSEPLAERERARFAEHSPDDLWFAWSGEEGEAVPRYWRVQGTYFAIEFVYPAGSKNHAHRVWRDFERDLGGPALKQHLSEEK